MNEGIRLSPDPGSATMISVGPVALYVKWNQSLPFAPGTPPAVQRSRALTEDILTH